MRGAGSGLILALLLLALPLQATEDEALTQLKRMSQAAHSVNYQGTFVYLHGHHVESVRIAHGVDSKGEHERLFTLSGKTREVIRENDEVRYFFPDERGVHLARIGRTPLSMIKTPPVERISHLYQLEMKGAERVAGRNASHVAVTPRDNYRYGRSYWIDQQAGLLLRADLIDDSGQVVEQMMFTSLEVLDAVPTRDLLPEHSAKDFVLLRPAQPQPAESGQEEQRWVAEALPPGFELQQTRHLTMHGKQVPVEHHVYSDGLASVSVFVEAPADEPHEFTGLSRMGAVNAYAMREGDARVIVVGEVPAITVQRIATAMRPRSEESRP